MKSSQNTQTEKEEGSRLKKYNVLTQYFIRQRNNIEHNV